MPGKSQERGSIPPPAGHRDAQQAMICSMTGYGRAQELLNGHDIAVEIKSVNHRYFEFSARTPRAYGYLDEKLKTMIYAKTARGKVDVFVSILSTDGVNTQVEVNNALARSYLDALRATGEALELPDNLRLTDLIRFSDIFTVRKTQEDEDIIWAAVEQVAQVALDKFLSMRQAEGSALCADVESRLTLMEAMANQVAERSPLVTAEYRERLFAKMQDILADRQIEEHRLLTEAAVFSEKTAVDEEIVRLHSHIVQFRDFLAQGEAVGRKMDFLVQEMNREVNTIGSKCQDVAIARLVLDMKSELEKIREQIQNIE